jgi:DNA-binding CsgD family transcriptional regulator
MLQFERNEGDRKQTRFKTTGFFTNRERQCVELLLKKYSNIKIAENLGMSIRTLNFYIKNIKCRMGCKTNRELIEILKSDDLKKYIFSSEKF